jgi:hypothetical protein
MCIQNAFMQKKNGGRLKKKHSAINKRTLPLLLLCFQAPSTQMEEYVGKQIIIQFVPANPNLTQLRLGPQSRKFRVIIPCEKTHSKIL